MNAMNAPADAARREKIGAASAGAVFVLLISQSRSSLPDPTPFQETSVRHSTRTRRRAVGDFLPGAIAVAGKCPGVTIRATGAIGFAVFVILIYRRMV
jgi:hypothetical protein